MNLLNLNKIEPIMIKKKNSIIICCYLIVQVLSAQDIKPGGVDGVQVWFQTVRLSDGHFGWEDLSGYNVQLESYNTDEPFIFDGMRNTNFHKALYFYNKNIEFFFTCSNFPQATIIAPFDFSGKESKYGDAFGEHMLFSLNARFGDGFVLTNDKVVHGNESGRTNLDYGLDVGRDLRNQNDDDETDDLKFKETNMRIASYYRTTKPNTSIWGESQLTNVFFGQEYLSNNPNNNSTINSEEFDSSSKNSYMRGYIPEFIMYKRVITPFERLKVESYLGMKYALTLDHSLLNSQGDIVWDINQNPLYNNRIAGHIRDDSSGLYQNKATTTYEERNGDLEDAHIDSYHTITKPRGESSDINLLRGQSSSKNLLYITEELGNTNLEDLSYTFWGDDNQAITTANSDPIAGMRLMHRNWELRTNRTIAYEPELAWEIDNDSLTFSGSAYSYTITYPSTAIADTVNAVTKTPLLGNDGFFEWKPSSLKHATILKFGTPSGSLTSGSHDYGVYIDDDKDYYYKIVQGEIKGRLGKLKKYNNTLRLEKRGNRIFVLQNGKYLDDDDVFFEIAPEDVDKTFYGSIQLTKHDSNPVTLKSFRHGGFVNSVGATIELSCLEGKAEEFDLEKYPDLQPFLIVDQSGTGAYKASDVVLYPMTNLSEERYKLIFNNVFWDGDGSTKDVFTFGYKNSSLLGFIEIQQATCSNGLPEANGKITLNMSAGSGSYTYTLTQTEAPDFIREDTFSGDLLLVENLAFGNYQLVVTDLATTNGALPDTFTRNISILEPTCNESASQVLIATEAEPLKILVFPVPASSKDDITIKVYTVQPSEVTLLFYSELGVFLKEESHTAPLAEHTFKTGLNQEAGLYLVKVITPFGERTKKIIIE